MPYRLIKASLLAVRNAISNYQNCALARFIKAHDIMITPLWPLPKITHVKHGAPNPGGTPHRFIKAPLERRPLVPIWPVPNGNSVVKYDTLRPAVGALHPPPPKSVVVPLWALVVT